MRLLFDIRKRLGLGSGGCVYIEETGEGAVLRTVPQIVAHARALARRYADVPGGSVADFIESEPAETGA